MASAAGQELDKLLLRCDAVSETDPHILHAKQKRLFQKLLNGGIVREAGRWDFLLPE